ncbi:hypothetical protein IQ255_19730 [Pleurocapsales cyanobacterium LEGE 10410]|nr:hypothetical protein [Pleurocapsales cyanobacterium LEGE 10410]
MKKAVLLVLTGTLALLTESCSFFSDFADSRKELEENSVQPISVQVNTAEKQAQKTEEEEIFADLEEEEAEPVQEITGLIPATNPEVRVRSSVRGRQDPFSTVTLNPRIEIETEEEIVVNARQNSANTQQNDFDQEGVDDSVLDFPEPPLFEPTLAQGVIISGLYKANGRTRLIVKAPEEDNSRYVEVGQYLSNGQVLVKSIDLDNFPTPMVILEESGIEVAKTIGETPEDGSEDLSSLPAESFSNQNWSSNISLNLN